MSARRSTTSAGWERIAIWPARQVFAELAELGVDLAIVVLPDAHDLSLFDFVAQLCRELEPLGRPVRAALEPSGN